MEQAQWLRSKKKKKLIESSKNTNSVSAVYYAPCAMCICIEADKERADMDCIETHYILCCIQARS